MSTIHYIVDDAGETVGKAPGENGYAALKTFNADALDGAGSLYVDGLGRAALDAMGETYRAQLFEHAGADLENGPSADDYDEAAWRRASLLTPEIATVAAALRALGEKVAELADDAERAGARVAKVEILELADGSRRWRAILELVDDIGEEGRMTVTTPPLPGAPDWARQRFTNPGLELDTF